MAKGLASDSTGLNARGARLGPSSAHHSFSGASLCRMVEGEIIPRLLMAHRHEPNFAPDRTKHVTESGATLAPLEIESFLSLPLHCEASDLLNEIERFLAGGVSVERIFIDLLANSARHLGDLWEDDECDFVDVTMGLWRLQEVMRIIAMRSPVIMRTVEAPPSVLFAPMPGDQHSFGALMIEEIFSRAGWESEVLFEPKTKELLAILSKRAFDLVGLTVTNDCPSGDLADLVSAIRSVSRNPAVRVIVGGRAINADPAIAAAAGADGTAPDANSALVLAEQLMAESRLVFDQA